MPPSRAAAAAAAAAAVAEPDAEPEPPGLARLIQRVQRKSKPWRDAWAGYCWKCGGGVHDPTKHDEKFLIGFMNFLGQSAADMSLRGTAYG